MNRQTCEIRRLDDYLDDELSADDELELVAHLDGCDNCRAMIEARAGDDTAWGEIHELLSVHIDSHELSTAYTQHSTGSSSAAFESSRNVLKSLAPTDDPAMVGRLGPYEISGVVGSGGMGVVLKAEDRSLDRVVAIKVMAPYLASSGSARKRFAREAKAAAAVLHPNVIAIHSVVTDGELPYLVMPYLRGESLQKRVGRDGPLPVSEILRIGSQIAAGLAAAHAQGLVHRDIKPANILLEEGVERVAITDFGLARMVDDATMTRSGVIAGTPQYMSPEQARGAPVDSSSDLFSLGSVLYTMCTARAPFRAETTFGVLQRINSEQARTIRAINPDVPEWLCFLVEKLMSKQPGSRFESAEQVAAVLEDCLAHIQQPAVVALPQAIRINADKVKPKRKLAGVLLMIATVTLALASIFGLGVVATSPSDITGKWAGEGWGVVELQQTKPGVFVGTYTKAASRESGAIKLKWSRTERRYNGTWSLARRRAGTISLRTDDDSIVGAWTTDKKSENATDSPRLAELRWTRVAPNLGGPVSVDLDNGAIVLRGNKPDVEAVRQMINNAERDADREKVPAWVGSSTGGGPLHKTDEPSSGGSSTNGTKMLGRIGPNNRSTIYSIAEDTGVTVNITGDGLATISSDDPSALDEALRRIDEAARRIKVLADKPLLKGEGEQGDDSKIAKEQATAKGESKQSRYYAYDAVASADRRPGLRSSPVWARGFKSNHGVKVAQSRDGRIAVTTVVEKQKEPNADAEGIILERMIELIAPDMSGAGQPFEIDESTPVGRTTELMFSPDGNSLALGTANGKVSVFDTRSRKRLAFPPQMNGNAARDKGVTPVRRVTGMAFSPDSQRLAVCGDSLTVTERRQRDRDCNGAFIVQVWDMEKRSLLYEVDAMSIVSDVAFSPDGKQLTCSGNWFREGVEETGFLVLGATDGEVLDRKVTAANGGTIFVEYTPSGKLLSGEQHHDNVNRTTIRMWDDNVAQHTVREYASYANFTADNQFVAVLCNGNSVRFLDPNSLVQLHEVRLANRVNWTNLIVDAEPGRFVVAGEDDFGMARVSVWTYRRVEFDATLSSGRTGEAVSITADRSLSMDAADESAAESGKEHVLRLYSLRNTPARKTIAFLRQEMWRKHRQLQGIKTFQDDATNQVGVSGTVGQHAIVARLFEEVDKHPVKWIETDDSLSKTRRPGELGPAKATEIRCNAESRRGSLRIRSIAPSGKKVKRGDVIVELESEGIERDINTQQVMLHQLKGRVRSSEAERENTRMDLDGRVADAADDVVRLRGVADEGAKGYRLASAKRALEKAEANLKRFETQSVADQRAEQIQISQQQSRLGKAQEQLELCMIRAPHDGVVAQTAGAQIGPGSEVRKGQILLRLQKAQ